MSSIISNIDITIIVGYLIAVLIFGIYVSKSSDSSEDYFLGGKVFDWKLIGLSMFSANISSTTIIGLAGAAYKTGIVNSVYEWMSGLSLIIAAIYFVPLYLKNNITTIPEFLEKRFDRRSQLFFSFVTVLSTILIDTAGTLYGGALVINVFFPSLILWQTALLLALFSGIYAAIGGLKAVVMIDAVQAIILIIGSGTLTWILFGKLDYSWSNLLATVPEGHFSVVRPMDDPGIPWLGLIVGVPFLGFWYWATNQYIVQRVLGAKSLNHARWGVIFAGFLKIIPLFIIVFPGAMAISLLPNISNPDSIFPTIVTKILPIGLVGIVLAGLISAIISSVNSALNSASTLIVIDFIKPNMPNLTSEEIAKYGKITTVIIMLLAAAWAPQIQNFQGLWAYLQQMFSIIVPPIAVIFLLGVFDKRTNRHGAFWTLMIGTGLGVLAFILQTKEIINIHYTISVGIMVGISAIIFEVVSRLTPAPTSAEITQLTYYKGLEDDDEKVAWHLNYKLHMAVLVFLIFVILIWLW
jgi:solute:Na+ symporter, SSS family